MHHSHTHWPKSELYEGRGQFGMGMEFPHGPLRARGSAWHSSLVAGATRDSTRHASWPLRGHTEILHSYQIAFAYVLCQRLRLSLFHTLFLWEMTLSHTFSVGNDFFPRFFSGKWLCPTESNLADFQLCPQRDLNPGLLQNADLKQALYQLSYWGFVKEEKIFQLYEHWCWKLLHQTLQTI